MDSIDCRISPRFGVLVGHYCSEIKVTAQFFIILYDKSVSRPHITPDIYLVDL